MSAVEYGDMEDPEDEELHRSCPLGICDGSGIATNNFGDEIVCACRKQERDEEEEG